MNEYVITPYHSLSNINFGDRRDIVRKKLDSLFQPFLKSNASKIETDAFDKLGMHIYYDKNYRVEAIEMFPPANPIYNNLELLTTPYNELVAYFKKIDEGLDESDVGFTSFKFGIGVFAPDKDEEPELHCETVIVFEKNYYS